MPLSTDQLDQLENVFDYLEEAYDRSAGYAALPILGYQDTIEVIYDMQRGETTISIPRDGYTALYTFANLPTKEAPALASFLKNLRLPFLEVTVIDHQFYDNAGKPLMASTPQSADVRCIILTGPSGVGKTTICNYVRQTFPHVDSLDTGDFFKAQLAHAINGTHTAPLEVLTGQAALEWFFTEYLRSGVSLYEGYKIEGEITGREMIQYIEAQRAIVPNLPSLYVRAYADFTQKQNPGVELIFTTAINEQELGHLQEVFPDNVVIGLECSTRVKRDGDNRSKVSLEYIDKVATYDIEDSLEVADFLVSSYSKVRPFVEF